MEPIYRNQFQIDKRIFSYVSRALMEIKCYEMEKTTRKKIDLEMKNSVEWKTNKPTPTYR